MSPACGVDLGSATIKAVSLSGSRQKPKLEAFGLGLNTTGNIETENNQEKIQIASMLKKILQDSGIKQRKVIAALPEAKVFSRVVELPALSDAELASAISWEAEQYVPIPIADVQLDYQILARPETAGLGAKMEIFLVAAPKLLVNKIVYLLELAGLEPEALETEVLALSRAAVKDLTSPPVLVCQMGATSTDFCVVEGDKIVMTRSVATGGFALTRALANDLGLELAQAEQYKRSYGLDPNQLQGKVRNGLLPLFNNLAGEMKKAMAFYSQEKKGKVHHVILTGAGAYMPEATGELTRQLGVEVGVGDPFTGIELDERQKQRLKGMEAGFSVAVGLAMRELK